MDKQLSRRAFLLAGVLTLASTIVSWRLFQLQVVQFTPRQAAPVEGRVVELPLPAPRGQIVDRHGHRLTRNELVYRLVIDRNLLMSEAVALRGLQATRQQSYTQVMDSFDVANGELGRAYLGDIARILAKGLGEDPTQCEQKLVESEQVEIVLSTQLPADRSFRLMEELEAARAVGIRWQPIWKRHYPEGAHAGHILGYTNHPGDDFSLNAAEGAERSLNEILEGRPGARRVGLDRLGAAVEDLGGAREPLAGENVRLTLDFELQTMVEEQLAAGIAKYRAERGAAVLLDPKTGGVLAMASWPEFEPNTRQGERANHAIAMRYEPGSTIKMVAIAGAFDRRLVGLDTVIDCGYAPYRDGATGVTVPDHHYYGSQPVRKVVSKSINIGTYKVARQLGVERWFEYAHAFGFGARTGISLTGEAAGTCRNSNNPTDFSRQSFGYALNVTPLQIASAYATVAAGGERHAPRLVEAVIHADGSEEVVPAAAPQQVISERAAEALTTALVEVTEKGGTATEAAIPGYEVAGKTGTAQRYREELRDAAGKITQRGGYVAGQYVVSFVGFVPAEDPAFVCAVVIDNPQTTAVSRYGGTIAAPMFQEIASRALTQLEIAPTEEVPDAQALADRR